MNGGGLQSEVCVQGGSRVGVAFQQQEHLVNLGQQQGRGRFLQGLPESARHSTVKHHGLCGLNGNLFLVVEGAVELWSRCMGVPFSQAFLLGFQMASYHLFHAGSALPLWATPPVSQAFRFPLLRTSIRPD